MYPEQENLLTSRPSEEPDLLGYTLLVRTETEEPAEELLEKIKQIWSIVAAWGRYWDADYVPPIDIDECKKAMPAWFLGAFPNFCEHADILEEREWMWWSSSTLDGVIKIDLVDETYSDPIELLKETIHACGGKIILVTDWWSEAESQEFLILKKIDKLFNSWDYAGGYAELEKAINNDPYNLTYLKKRAWRAFYERKDYELARDDFTRIINLETDLEKLYNVHLSRMICHRYLGDREGRLEDLNWLIDNGFGTETKYSTRGKMKLEDGDFETAIEDFTTVYEMSKQWIFNLILHPRYIAYYKLGLYDKALHDLDLILSRIKYLPFVARFRKWRGLVLYKMDETEKALEDFHTSAKANDEETYASIKKYLQVYFPDEIEK